MSLILTLCPAVDVRADADPVRSSARLELSHAHDGWKPSGIRVAAGDHVTLFGEGHVAMGLPVALPPNAYLWLRIGAAGRAANPPTDAHSFTADRAGEVFVAVRPAGVYWNDESGTFPEGFEGVPDYSLTASTRIDFEWLYRNLPALGPESEPKFHDYLSIAVEFDNGQDLTWFWSGHMEAGMSFTCPLPGRIVGVWFINAGLFGGPGSEALFANVVVQNGGESVAVFC